MSAEHSPSLPELSSGIQTVQVMDASAITRALRRIAHQIIESNGERGVDRLALVGIQSRGVIVAKRLAGMITEIEGSRPAFGVLDVSMHRDDFGRRPNLASIKPTDLPIDLDSHTIVLADDVFSTGRTVRAAMDALTDYGRPPRIQLATLVDRGHRELPIRPDYVGKNLPTALHERILVRFSTRTAIRVTTRPTRPHRTLAAQRSPDDPGPQRPGDQPAARHRQAVQASRHATGEESPCPARTHARQLLR